MLVRSLKQCLYIIKLKPQLKHICLLLAVVSAVQLYLFVAFFFGLFYLTYYMINFLWIFLRKRGELRGPRVAFSRIGLGAVILLLLNNAPKHRAYMICYAVWRALLQSRIRSFNIAYCLQIILVGL